MRLSKTVDNQTTTHVWDGDSIVMDLYAPTGTYTAAPVSGMVYSREIGLIARTDVVFGQNHNPTSDYQYYLFDAHGDVVQLSSEGGSVIKDYTYDAFGNEVNPDPDDTNPFRYCGEYFDSNSGTYYLRARYYNPAIGRFASADTHWNTGNMIYGDNPSRSNPMPDTNAISQSINLYTYCMNNPVMFVDVSGLYAAMYVGVHRVSISDCFHTSIIVIVDKESIHYDNKLLTNYPVEGVKDGTYKYLTIGAAGDDIMGLGGKLNADYNRKKDIDLTIKVEYIVIKNEKDASIADSDVTKVIDATNSYIKNSNNSINYALTPVKESKEGYNSNSFVSGLLGATSLKAQTPTAGNVPGWDKPLPKEKYETKDVGQKI